MRIDVVTIFPDMVRTVTQFGICGRAISDGKLTLGLWDPRDYTEDRYRRIDDRPYGGGPGMVMMGTPLKLAIDAARGAGAKGAKVIYLSPQGARFDQKRAESLAKADGLILLAGRYEGVDERLIETEVDEEISIGDYVVSGGELPAMVLIESVARLLPGVLGNSESALADSFSAGLLDCGHYTRPDVFAGKRVPDVLKSGDHDAIRRWRLKQSLGRTWLRRPEILSAMDLDSEQQELLSNFKAEYANSENAR